MPHHDPDLPKLYQRELAPWWPLMSAVADYAEEAAEALAIMTEALGHTPQSLLELGSGGGNNAFHLKASVPRVTLTDLSDAMLDLSRALNPESRHIKGDMRRVRLEQTFDAVLIHDAIMYMTTRDDLRAAIETAWTHCAPGGVALLMPDDVRENFSPNETHGGHDGDDGRGFRYLEWHWDPDPDDDTFVTDYAYLIRDTDGSVQTIHDRHTFGLFSRDTWLSIMSDVGFTTRTIIDAYDRELFIGVKAL